MTPNDRTAEFPGSDAVPPRPFGAPVANRRGNPSPARAQRLSRDGQAQGRGRAQAPVPGVGASPAPGTGLKGAEWRAAVKAAQGKGRRTPRAAAGKQAATPLEPPADGARLTATARCIRGCDWTATGTAAEVDKAAEAHTVKPPKHPTAVVAELVA